MYNTPVFMTYLYDLFKKNLKRALFYNFSMIFLCNTILLKWLVRYLKEIGWACLAIIWTYMQILRLIWNGQVPLCSLGVLVFHGMT
jgi:hypothetical protein